MLKSRSSLPQRKFDLMWNFQRKNRRHVYLIAGDMSPSQVLMYFKNTFGLAAVVVHVTQETTTRRIEEVIDTYRCCVFYISEFLPVSMRELRHHLTSESYSPSLLNVINKVYRGNDPNRQCWLAT